MQALFGQVGQVQGLGRSGQVWSARYVPFHVVVVKRQSCPVSKSF